MGCRFLRIVQKPLVTWIVVSILSYIAIYVYIENYTTESEILVIATYSLIFFVGLWYFIQQCFLTTGKTSKLYVQSQPKYPHSELYKNIVLQTRQLNRLLLLPVNCFLPFHLPCLGFATIGLMEMYTLQNYSTSCVYTRVCSHMCIFIPNPVSIDATTNLTCCRNILMIGEYNDIIFILIEQS